MSEKVSNAVEDAACAPGGDAGVCTALKAALEALVPLAESLLSSDAGDGYDDPEDDAFGAECESAINAANAAIALAQGR